MSFPRYPKYKDSGVEWLGEVPEHWDVRPVASLAVIINGYPFDSERFDPAVGYPLIRIRDLGSDQAEAYYNGEMVERATVTSADVLIGMDGDFNVGRWRGTGIAMLNQRMCCIRGSTPLVTRLLEYALPRPLANINAVTYSTTVKHLSSSQVEKIRVALPPAEVEREAIATFLDRETAKIDALIAEQQRLIELLQEKRQAVISHAVTKGLNPDVPVKDSGIEWLGAVPEHWEVRPNRAVMTLRKREVGAAWSHTPLLSLTLRGVVLRDIDSGDGKYPSDFSTYQLVERQDLVFCLFDMDETPRTVGLSAHAGMITAAYDVFHCKADVCQSYVYYFYLHIDQYKRLRPFYTGLRKTVRTPTFLSIKMPFPPAAEQEAIAAFLSREIAKSDALIAEAELAIALLQERRSALISAAVTGQIDVRGLAGSEAA